MDLAIVIVSYNTRQLTDECLGAVYGTLRDSGLNFGVWLVDNASADGSAQMARERYPQVHLTASVENHGFARGTNIGLEQIAALPESPRYVLLLNPDTRPLPGALRAMVAFLDEHPDVGAAGAQLLYADGRFQHGAFHFPTLPMIVFDFWPLHHRLLDSWLNGRYSRRRYEAGAPFPIDHPLGAALMIRWETLRQVGPLDEGFFMYCEEIDWCLRARRAGWPIYCVPQAKIIHHAGQSTQQFRDRMFVALWRSRYRLFAKHYGAIYSSAARLLVRVAMRRDIARVQRHAQRGEIDADELERRLAAYRQVMEL